MTHAKQFEGSLTKTSADQAENGGSTPTPSTQFKFAPCLLSEVSDFVKKHHYSHTSKNGVISHCFSARVNDDVLVGAALFGHTAGNEKTGSIFKPPFDGIEHCRELTRFVMIDEMPKHSESMFIGLCLRWLRNNTHLLGLISYADPEHNHTGIIYQATNWLYTGRSTPSRKFIVDGGVEMHRKRAWNLYANSSVPMIQQMGHDVAVRITEPKHRYIYLLKKGLRPFVKYPILKFVNSGE